MRESEAAPEEFMAQLEETDRADLTERARPRRWPLGASLFLEGELSSTVVIVTSGRVKVFTLTDQGEEIVLAVRGPGALLGELSAVDGAPRSAKGRSGSPSKSSSTQPRASERSVWPRCRSAWISCMQLCCRDRR